MIRRCSHQRGNIHPEQSLRGELALGRSAVRAPDEPARRDQPKAESCYHHSSAAKQDKRCVESSKGN